MPSFVPRYLEPYQKRELFQERVKELQKLVRSSTPGNKTLKAAERVRSAALGLVKSQRSLIASRPEEQARAVGKPVGASAQQLRNLDQESERWLSLPAAQIIREFAGADPEAGADSVVRGAARPVTDRRR